MDIPHSGNACSGLCRPPCGHEGCWQCAKIVQVEAEKAVERQVKSLQAKLEKEQAKAVALAARTIRPGTATASYSENQTTSITRVALENLCARAGLEVEWNGGDPIIRDPKDRTGHHLNNVTSGSVLAEATRRIAMGASASIDQMVRDALKGPTPETLRIQGIPGIHKQVTAAKVMQGEVERIMREKVVAEEREAREVLKAQGASDDDIAAAAALLGSEPQQFITSDMVQAATVDITDIVKNWAKPSPVISISYKGIELSGPEEYTAQIDGEFIDVE